VTPPTASVVSVSAPGKLMICGEYAILHGEVALVAAVDRRMYVTRSEVVLDRSGSAADGWADSTHLLPEIVVSEALATQFFRVPEQKIAHTPEAKWMINVRQLHEEHHKLGLGSSAAAAAAGAAAVFAAHGVDVESQSARQQIWGVARAAHLSIANSGSGADVAAAVFGGFLKCRLHEGELDVAPQETPSSLVWRAVWTRKQARTREFLSQVERMRVAQPARHSALMRAIGACSTEMIAAMQRADTGGLMEAVADHHQRMAELGQQAGAPVVTGELARIAELARTAGGAAKPSGAGGGDVAVAVFATELDADRFAAECDAAGFKSLTLRWGAQGVRREQNANDAKEVKEVKE
jgi:phosphomevalonate kinase